MRIFFLKTLCDFHGVIMVNRKNQRFTDFVTVFYSQPVRKKVSKHLIYGIVVKNISVKRFSCNFFRNISVFISKHFLVLFFFCFTQVIVFQTVFHNRRSFVKSTITYQIIEIYRFFKLHFKCWLVGVQIQYFIS